MGSGASNTAAGKSYAPGSSPSSLLTFYENGHSNMLKPGDLLLFYDGDMCTSCALVYDIKPGYYHPGSSAKRKSSGDGKTVISQSRPKCCDVVIAEGCAREGKVVLKDLSSRMRKPTEKNPLFSYRRLNIVRTAEYVNILKRTINMKVGCTFDKTKYSELISRSISSSMLFASEFVADVYLRLGLLSPPWAGGRSPADYSPLDFQNTSQLVFEGGVSAAREMRFAQRNKGKENDRHHNGKGACVLEDLDAHSHLVVPKMQQSEAAKRSSRFTYSYAPPDVRRCAAC
jgi:hypothetical protein